MLSGEKVEPKVFNDDNVGPVMDRIYESGTIKIFSEIVLKAMKTFSIDSPYVHFDTTSITLYFRIFLIKIYLRACLKNI